MAELEAFYLNAARGRVSEDEKAQRSKGVERQFKSFGNRKSHADARLTRVELSKYMFS